MQLEYKPGQSLLAQATSWTGTGGAAVLCIVEEIWGLLALGPWFKAVQDGVAEHRSLIRALQDLCEIGKYPFGNSVIKKCWVLSCSLACSHRVELRG